MIERIVRFAVDGQEMAPFICTPEALDELAIGYLFTQGMINGVGDIADIRIDGLAVSVTTRTPLCAALPLAVRMDSLRPVTCTAQFSLEDLCGLMQDLLRVDGHFGTHCLALGTPEGVHFREDIGRHNALDKVIGRGLLDGTDFARCCAAATGRVSLEMLLKTASAGIPIIVSKKYPSDLAVSLAEELGVCIVGKALSTAPIVYSAPKNLHERT